MRIGINIACFSSRRLIPNASSRRAWQLFDWVRALPEDNELRKLCDAHTYTTMISLCGPWQQVRRALSLVADMKQRSLQCGIQANFISFSLPAFCSIA